MPIALKNSPNFINIINTTKIEEGTGIEGKIGRGHGILPAPYGIRMNFHIYKWFLPLRLSAY